MYNNDIPTRAELPSSAQLIKSTILAIAAAIVILVTVILPAEYAIDPTWHRSRVEPHGNGRN